MISQLAFEKAYLSSRFTALAKSSVIGAGFTLGTLQCVWEEPLFGSRGWVCGAQEGRGDGAVRVQGGGSRQTREVGPLPPAQSLQELACGIAVQLLCCQIFSSIINSRN